MNKYFASKIAVVETPSSWNPKDAGYDILHDAILANEYQTTPEDAINKIEAKGTPDFSKTAPVIKWLSVIGDTIQKNVVKPALSEINVDGQTSELTENDTKLRLFKGKKFDKSTSKYVLYEPVYVDPTTIDFDKDSDYYFERESILYDKITKTIKSSSGGVNYTVYKVVGCTKNMSKSNWNNTEYDSITYILDLITLIATELEIDKSDKGLYKANDDYGTTYYYRGNVKNNNVYFA